MFQLQESNVSGNAAETFHRPFPKQPQRQKQKGRCLAKEERTLRMRHPPARTGGCRRETGTTTPSNPRDRNVETIPWLGQTQTGPASTNRLRKNAACRSRSRGRVSQEKTRDFHGSGAVACRPDRA